MPSLAGRAVHRVGYGAMQLERGGDPGVLRRAQELGVNHIDTAEFYGGANALIRSALSPYPDDLVLVSKVGAEREGEGLVAAQRPEQLRAQVEANLASLGLERIDVVNLRRLDGGAGIRASGDQIVDLDDQLATLAALRDEGKIGGVGLSNVSLEQVQHALPTGVACVQNRYSFVDRADEPLLDLCRQHDVAWVPFFPLGSAFPGQRRVTDEPAVIAAAERLGATPAQVGLAWLLGHAPNILLIPGTRSVAHLEENVAAGALVLDEETLDAQPG